MVILYHDWATKSRKGDITTLKIGYIRVGTQEQNTLRQEILMVELTEGGGYQLAK